MSPWHHLIQHIASHHTPAVLFLLMANSKLPLSLYRPAHVTGAALASNHIHFDNHCVSKKCNVLCCSVQLPIYVKPQITCDGNTAQVNIMVGGSAAFSSDAKQVYHFLVSHFSGRAQTAAGELFLARRWWPRLRRRGRRRFEGEKNGGGCGCDYSCQNCANDKYAAPLTR
jgi:hypothetical protein